MPSIPHKLMVAIDNAGLSAAEFRVFFHLAATADKDGIATASYAEMTRKTGMGRSTIGRALTSLSEAGRLVREPKGFRGLARYRIPSIVPPQERKPANRPATGTVEAPIVPPRERPEPTPEPKTPGDTKPPITLEAARSHGAVVGLTPELAEFWWHKRNAQGWLKGTSGGAAVRITSPVSDMAASVAWVREEFSKVKQAGPNGRRARAC